MKQFNRELNEVSNFMSVVGLLAEKNLELSSYKKDGNDVECIRGSLSIKTDDANIVTLKVFTNRFTSKGEESKAFKGMVTVMEEYRSIADAGEGEADKVSAIGKLNPKKPYKAQDGKVYVGNEYGCNFISRVTDPSKYDPQATFNVEALIIKCRPEMKLVGDTQEETGRLIVELCTPVYGGIAVYNAILDSEEAIEFFTDNVSKGQTVLLTIDLISRTERQEPKKSTGGFGKKPSDRTFSRVVNEMIIVGAEEPYAEFEESSNEPQKAFDPQSIRDMLTERENTIKSVENSEAPKRAPQSTGSKKGFGSTPSVAPKAPIVEDDDLPF